MPAGFAAGHRRSARWPGSDSAFSVDPFWFDQGLELLAVRGELKGLLAAQRQEAAMAQRFMKQAKSPILQLLIKINQYVTT
ncbi:hypothetical protein D3C84_1142730 [compost metagenome]